MAQYTPNFNLYEPDSTDDFGDFRTEFNNNMDIIDANLGGGGGSGGHTIYDKDGNALAQESGLQFTGNVNVSDDSGNGRTVVDILGGGGNVYGAFIDPSRILVNSAYTSNLSYTATEDCYIYTAVALNSNTGGSCAIDGQNIASWWNGSGGAVAEAVGAYLKKGQTFTATATNASSSGYTVYGLTQGTNGIYAPVIYSDNERVIGVWRDNKPLYQKTCIFNPPFSAGNNTFNLNLSSECVIKTYSLFMHDNVSSPITIGQGDELKMINIGYNSGVNRAVVWIASGTLPYLNNGQIWITVQYTKTTDGAGSGNWNTDGVPTHHYSTSEQVIGTWIDGKPLYERTFDFNNQVIPDNTWSNNILGGNLPTIQIKSYDGYFGLENTDWSANFNYIRNNDGGFNEFFTANSTGSDISVRPNMNAGVNVVLRTCTVRYTKSTD